MADSRKAGLEAILADPALIRPVFQQIVDLKRSTVVGFEMLARFAAEPAGTPLDWLAADEFSRAFAAIPTDSAPTECVIRRIRNWFRGRSAKRGTGLPLAGQTDFASVNSIRRGSQ